MCIQYTLLTEFRTFFARASAGNWKYNLNGATLDNPIFFVAVAVCVSLCVRVPALLECAPRPIRFASQRPRHNASLILNLMLDMHIHCDGRDSEAI